MIRLKLTLTTRTIIGIVLIAIGVAELYLGDKTIAITMIGIGVPLITVSRMVDEYFDKKK